MNRIQMRTGLSQKFRNGQPQQSRHRSNSRIRCGNALGLRIADHLNGVFRVPQNSIAALQLVLGGLGDPVFCCQLVQCQECLARSQLRIPTPRDELPRLSEKLDLTNAAAPQFYVVTRHIDRPSGAGLRADFQAQRMGLLDRSKIKIAAPDERLHLIEKLCASPTIACANPRFDKRRPLPCAAQTFIIVQCRAHRDANRRHRGIRP